MTVCRPALWGGRRACWKVSREACRSAQPIRQPTASGAVSGYSSTLGRFGLQGLGLVLQQFAGRDLKEVAEHAHRLELQTNDGLVAADKTMGRRHGQVAECGFVQRIGSREAVFGHQLFELQSHVEHATEDSNIYGSSQGRTYRSLTDTDFGITVLGTQTETDMRHTRMVSTRQVPTYVTGNGVLGICPTCGEPNVAEFGKDGNLVWWPNAEVGKWCRHAQGAYQGARLVETVMQFVYLPLVATGRYGEPAA